MAEDIFGRVIRIDDNVENIRKALLEDVKINKNFKGTHDEEATRKSIADSLLKISNLKLDTHLTALTNAVKAIGGAYSDQKQKKNNTSLKQSIERGVANALKSMGNRRGSNVPMSGATDIDKFIKTLTKTMYDREPPNNTAKDKVNNFLGNAGAIAKSVDIFSEKAGASLVTAIGTAFSKSAGFLVSKIAGAAGGGLVSGILDTVLKPINEELDFISTRAQITFSKYGPGEGAVERMNELVLGVDEIDITGQRVVKVQQVYYNNLRKGIKDEKTALNITNKGLQTAYLLGSSADDTSELFTKWHQELGASTLDLGIMARGLTQISRETGVTGNNLLKAAQSSEQFMKNMRLSGTFTASTANNMTELLARAQKAGTSGGANKILGALSGSILDEGGDERIRSLLVAATGGNQRQLSKLTSGVAGGDKGYLKSLSQYINQRLADAARFATGGRTGNFAELTPEEKGRASIVTKQTIGGLGSQEAYLTAQQLAEVSKTYTEKVADLNKAVEAETNVKRKAMKSAEIEDLTQKTSINLLSDFNSALQRTGSTTGALAEFARDREKTGDLRTLSGASGPAAITDILMKTLEQNEKRQKEAGVTLPAQQIVNRSEIAGAIDNPVVFKSIVERLSEQQGFIEKQRQAAHDPAQKVQEAVAKVEAVIRKELSETIQNNSKQIVDQLTKINNWLSTNLSSIIKGDFSSLGNFGKLLDALKKIGEILTPDGVVVAGLTLLALRLVGGGGVLGLGGALTVLGGTIIFLIDRIQALDNAFKEHAKQYVKQGGGAFEGSVNLAKDLRNIPYGDPRVAVENAAIGELRNNAAGAEEALNKGKWTIKLSKLFFGGNTELTEAQARVTIEKYKQEAERRAALLELRRNAMTGPAYLEDETYNKGIRRLFPAQQNFTEQAAGDYALGNQSKLTQDKLKERQSDINEKLKAARDAVSYIEKHSFTGGGTTGGKTKEEWIQDIAKLEQEMEDTKILQKKLTDAATTHKDGGSIFTYDTHLEKIFKKPIQVIPMIPGLDVEAEIKKRQAGDGDDSMNNIEDHTDETAQNTADAVTLLSAIGRLLQTRLTRVQSGGDIQGEKDMFIDEILSTEWPNARFGRSVGLEMDLTDLA